MNRQDVLARLVRAVDDLGPLAVPADVRAQLVASCHLTRLALGAAACSVARLDDDALEYVAADGAGADAIVGTRLELTRGIAGYVARTGQALAIDRVRDDARFARDVAEGTGYVPTTLLVVPITAPGGDPIGVLSVLDRTAASVDALAVASAAAAQVALVLPTLEVVVGLGPSLVRALAAAVDDGELSAALRRRADERARATDDETGAALLRIAALLAELRAAGPATAAAAERMLRELTALAARPRRR